MTAIHEQRLARLLVALFVVLSVIYSIVTPLFEPPDEMFHYPYVAYLAAGNGLPVQSKDDVALWEQEGSQPPLYYVLAAMLTMSIDTGDLAQIRVPNPHAIVGVPLSESNKNVVIHTPRETWPWRGTTLAVHLARLLSVLLGAATVWTVYRLARRLFPGRPLAALGAEGFVALNPMFLSLSGAVNNDNLVILLASVTLLRLVELIHGDPGRRSLQFTGLIIGFACLSKLSGLALLPLAAVALALREARLAGETPEGAPIPDLSWREWRQTFWCRPVLVRWAGDLIAVTLPVVLVAGWWYMRNVTLYGDLTGLNVMLDIFGRRKAVPLNLSTLWAEFRGFRMSFWGIFGMLNVLMRPQWAYNLLDGLSLIALAGLVRHGIQHWRRGHLRPGNWRAWLDAILLAVWIGAVCVSLLRWTSMTKASQGRLIFPALAAIAPLFVFGWLSWFRPRGQRCAVMGLLLPLAALAVTSPWVAIRPAYAPPPILTAADIPTTAQEYDVTYGGVMRLRAYQIETTQAEPGEAVRLALYWESLAAMDEDLSIYVHLFGRDGQNLGQVDTYPGGGNYPTSLWQPGQIVREEIVVPVADDAVTPAAAEIVAGLYRLDTMAPLDAVDQTGNSVGRPVLGRVKISAPTDATMTPPEPEYAPIGADNLDNHVRLLGYDLPAGPLSPGQAVPLTLYWQVLAPVDDDYQIFVHLAAADEILAGQGDGPPLQGQYPTSFWGTGEILTDLRTLQIAPGAVPGDYRLWVGFYRLADGTRLPALDADGAPAGDRLLLGTLTVAP